MRSIDAGGSGRPVTPEELRMRLQGVMDQLVPDECVGMTVREQRAWSLLNGLVADLRKEQHGSVG